MITKEEFTKEAKALTDVFPPLKDFATAETWAAWHANVSDWDLRLFQIACGLVCQKVAQWNRGMNLVGVLGQVLPEASQIYGMELERLRIRDERRMLPEEIASPEEARKHIAEIKRLTSGVVSRMKA